MKPILLISMFLVGCQTTKPRPHTYGGALKEVTREGSPEEFQPEKYEIGTHVCVSKPIFDLDGNFIKKSIRCW